MIISTYPMHCPVATQTIIRAPDPTDRMTPSARLIADAAWIGCSFQVAPAPVRAGVDVARRWVGDQSEGQPTVDGVGNRHAPRGEPLQEVLCSVDGVDDPDSLVRQTVSGLLAHESVLGEGRENSILMMASTALSASLTRSCGPFCSMVSSVRFRWWPRATAAASRITC